MAEPVPPGLLERMCAALEHRGPDSRGMFEDSGVALGIQRLAVIDVAGGDQPIANEDGSVVVVMNGEIYNYQELRADLHSRGHILRTASDTEVIPHLYEEYGADLVNHLRGMFAFGLWDHAKRQLLLGRDRVGKKPLYYHVTETTLSFASEVQSLLEDHEVPRAVDHKAIDEYLLLQYVPDGSCAFAGVSKLPAAHVLRWRAGMHEMGRYWRLSYAVNPAQRTEQEIQEELRRQLLAATRLRLRSDVPLGAFLSGGVDSSAVVAAMAQHASGSVKTFSIGFPSERFDETAHARKVAEIFGTDHHEMVVEPDPDFICTEIARVYGEPYADHSAIPSLYLAEMTRREVTVALNGDGGDENFAGYPRHYAARLSARLSHLPSPARATLRGLMGSVGGGGRQGSTRHRIGRMADSLYPSVPDSYAHWLAFFSAAERQALYTPEFAHSLVSDSGEDVIREVFERSDATSLVNRLLDVDVNTYLVGDLLVKMDRATMAHSLEVRSPLLDHQFMEFAAGLRGELKLSGSTGKRIFKDAMRRWLPASIIDRPKMGLSVPMADWLRGPLQAVARDVLLDTRAAARGYFRPAAVQTLLDEHLDGRADHGNQIWALLQLELWQRTYIDQRAPASAVG